MSHNPPIRFSLSPITEVTHCICDFLIQILNCAYPLLILNILCNFIKILLAGVLIRIVNNRKWLIYPFIDELVILSYRALTCQKRGNN